VYVSGSVTVGAAGLSKTSTQYAPARNGDVVVASSAPTAAAGMVSAAVQTPWFSDPKPTPIVMFCGVWFATVARAVTVMLALLVPRHRRP